MVSRMEKYYRDDLDKSGRVRKNASLYDTIYDEVEYTNVEGIATIEKTNEIDIAKVRELLRQREVVVPTRTIPTYVPIKEVEHDIEEDKNYDVKEMLNKAKDNREEEPRLRSISNTQFDILKKLNIKNHNEDIDDNELKELINTITNTSMMNKLGDRELSLDMLQDLKSSGNTIITDIMMQELLKDNTKEPEKDEIDKSFYTSSLGFGDSDFEDLKHMNKSLQKNNVLIKVMVTMLTIVVIGVIAFTVYTILK